MKRLAVLLGAYMLLALDAKAQVVLNQNGLYQNNDGGLFTGTLQSSENGRKSVMEIREGRLNGEVKYYYANGNLLESGNYDNGQKNGKWLRYNESGITVGLAIYSAGKKNGTWIVWNDAGTKIFEMHYTNGEKTGTWYNWDEKGELLSSKDFTNGN